MDEAAIDFEFVEGETTQIVQAGIPGAEVIEREAHAERFEPAHRRLRAVDIADERAFGDFQLEAGRIELRLVQNALDTADEIRAAELQWRHVHSDVHARPDLGIAASAAQHPVAELDD